jgi:hypothetical protein
MQVDLARAGQKYADLEKEFGCTGKSKAETPRRASSDGPGAIHNKQRPTNSLSRGVMEDACFRVSCNISNCVSAPSIRRYGARSTRLQILSLRASLPARRLPARLPVGGQLWHYLDFAYFTGKHAAKWYYV